MALEKSGCWRSGLSGRGFLAVRVEYVVKPTQYEGQHNHKADDEQGELER